MSRHAYRFVYFMMLTAISDQGLRAQSAYSYLTYYFSSDGSTLYATTVTSGQMPGASGTSHIYTAYTAISGPPGTQMSGGGTVSTGWVPAQYYWSVQSNAQINSWIGGTYLISTEGTAYCTNVGRTYYDNSPPPTPVFVQVPTFVTFVNEQSHQTVGPAFCSQVGLPNASGFLRNVTLQLLDQGHGRMGAGYTMADSISPSGQNDLGLSQTSTGSFNTNNYGQWPDGYFICSNSCPGNGGKSVGTQSWTASGKPLPYGNNIVYQCNSITIDGN